MTDEAVSAEIAAMTFEQALGELEAIVRQLEEGKGGLDEAIGAYERGALLKRHCEAKLQEARTRVERIVLGADGSVGSEPADKDREKET